MEATVQSVFTPHYTERERSHGGVSNEDKDTIQINVLMILHIVCPDGGVSYSLLALHCCM